MGIKQLNGGYVPAEDRILLRVSTDANEEFRFWLTRHIVKNIIGGCQTLAQQMLAKLTQTDAAGEKNFRAFLNERPSGGDGDRDKLYSDFVAWRARQLAQPRR